MRTPLMVYALQQYVFIELINKNKMEIFLFDLRFCFSFSIYILRLFKNDENPSGISISYLGLPIIRQ